MTSNESKPRYQRYQARYRDGYYVVVDAETGSVVPPPAGHYKQYRDGYLWNNAATLMANQYNAEGVDARGGR